MLNYIFDFIVLVVAELLFIKAARYYMLLKRSNSSSSHALPTPTGGGIVFFIAIIAAFFMSHFDYPWFVAGVSIVAGVSLIDDYSPVRIRVRLAMHILAIIAILWQLELFTTLTLPMLTGVFIVSLAYINAYNFMDGIDGITAAYSLVLLLTLALLNSVYSFIAPAWIWLLVCACAAFGVFNFRRRSICFAGDVGSITMAVATLFILLKMIIATGSWAWIVLVSVYGVDTCLTIIRRLYLHQRVWQGHHMHLYQILSNELRVPHLIVATIYAVLQLLINIGAIYAPIDPYIYLAAVLVVLSIAYIAVLRRCKR